MFLDLSDDDFGWLREKFDVFLDFFSGFSLSVCIDVGVFFDGGNVFMLFFVL